MTYLDFTRKRKCAGTNEHGLPCRMPPKTGNAWCWFHDPETEQERFEARSLGGSSGSRVVSKDEIVAMLAEAETLETLQDIRSMIGFEIARLRSRSMGSNRPVSIAESTALKQWAALAVTVWEREALIVIMDHQRMIEARQEQLALDRGIGFVGIAEQLKSKLLVSTTVDIIDGEAKEIEEDQEE